jgi:hypothetical protein
VSANHARPRQDSHGHRASVIRGYRRFRDVRVSSGIRLDLRFNCPASGM